MIPRFLFGDDIFISYSRRDGAHYSAALANELSKKGRDLSCFLDQWGASAANELSKPVLRALRRSSVLVLVGTPGAASSPMVREEVKQFSKTGWLRSHRAILPINVAGGFDQVSWNELTGLHRTTETEEARMDGLPSESVVRLIVNSHSYMRRNQRARWLSLGAAAMLVISAGASSLAMWQAQQTVRQTEIASARLLTEQANVTRAQSPGNLPLSVLLAASSMQRLESLGLREATTDRALREGLALLPAPVMRVGHQFRVAGLALSPDRKYLATAGEDKVVRIWRLNDGQSEEPVVHQQSPISMTFSPDGRYLATADGVTVRIWDASIRRAGHRE